MEKRIIVSDQKINPQLLKKSQTDFVNLSQARLERMLEAFNLTQQDCVRLLPLLFHVNHPMLPGYVDKLTPIGIPNYNPSALEQKIAKTVSRTFIFKPRAYLKFEILGLYLMGSTGTLAQTVRSDLDLWICIEEELSADKQKKLTQKAVLISRWFEKKGIELNCFLVFAEQFKKNTQQTIDKENCGTTQNFLLLDEFYRTAIWLSGRMPLWWLVPPESDYAEYVKALIVEKRVEAGDWIDFGEIEHIPPTEYFSATLWHLYKAISSPYKSSLKLLILEIYARFFPQTGVLSSQFKQMVYQGESALDKLDPYYLVLSLAEKFIHNQPQRLEFLRRAFYLKAGCKIQIDKDNPQNWRYAPLKKLVERWGWSQARLDYLNHRHEWCIKEVISERVDLVRELNHSYHFLSNFARIHGVLNSVNQKELISLGRMLYAHFERRAGKVDCVNTGIAREVSEPVITLKQTEQRWRVYLGRLPQNQLIINQPVFQGASFFSVIAWAVCNGVVNQNSRFQIYSPDKNYFEKTIDLLVRNLTKLNQQHAPKLGEIEFQENAKTIRFGIFLNTRADPLAVEKDAGVFSVENQQDGFYWGTQNISLLSQFSIFYINSWGERCTQEYDGEFSWIKFFIDHKENLFSKETSLGIFSQFLPNFENHQTRIFLLLQEWYRCCALVKKKDQVIRYIMSQNDGFLRVDFSHQAVTFERYKHLELLLGSFAQKASSNIGYCLDKKLRLSQQVQQILTNTVDRGYLCYLIQLAAEEIKVFIKDKSGCIFYQRHQRVNSVQLINHYQQFFDSVAYRVSNYDVSDYQISYLRLNLLPNNKNPQFSSVEPSAQNLAHQYHSIQAIATLNSEEQICFDLFYDTFHYRYSDLGELVYLNLAKHIVKHRRLADDYPIFITDIDLSGVKNHSDIMDYLEYKKEVEEKIANAFMRVKLS